MDPPESPTKPSQTTSKSVNVTTPTDKRRKKKSGGDGVIDRLSDSASKCVMIDDNNKKAAAAVASLPTVKKGTVASATKKPNTGDAMDIAGGGDNDNDDDMDEDSTTGGGNINDIDESWVLAKIYHEAEIKSGKFMCSQDGCKNRACSKWDAGGKEIILCNDHQEM